MNYVKNQSVLTQDNFNACMAIGLTTHSVNTVPFHTSQIANLIFLYV